MACQQLTPTQLDELLLVNPNPKKSPTLEECEDECGVCCVASCPSDLTAFTNSQPDGCSTQTLIPLDGPVSRNSYNNECSVNGYNDMIFNMSATGTSLIFSEWSTDPPQGTPNLKYPKPADWNVIDPYNLSWPPSVLNEYVLRRSTTLPTNPSPLTWAPGYPQGDYFVEIRQVRAESNLGGSGIGAGYGINATGGVPTQGLTGSISWNMLKRETKYFQCEGGVVTDKTSEAISNAGAEEIIGGQNVGTKSNFSFTSWSCASPCYQEQPQKPCCSCPNYWETLGECPGGYDNCYDYIYSSGVNNWTPSQLNFISQVQLYSSISDLGGGSITSLIYQCDPTKNRPACLQAVGFWNPNVSCQNFDCG